jgi:drug/metabolite transporter (DMT)-like permease
VTASRVLQDDRRYGVGAAAGIGAAVLFGVSAPVAKLLLPGASPWLLGGLLYLGAGFGLSAVRLLAARQRKQRTDHLQRRDVPLLAAIVVSGGVAGPVLLMVGLTRVSGVVGSLLLNLEAVFTILLATLFFGDRLRVGESLGAALTVAGAALLTGPGPWGHTDWMGVLAVTAACASWGLDNNLTQRLSIRNPIQIVQIKTVSAGLVNVVLAVLVGATVPRHVLPAALTLGFFSYGISIVLDVYALRFLGAAREAAFFATAPFAGAVASIPLLGERLTGAQYAAGALMIAGVGAMVRLRQSRS